MTLNNDFALPAFVKQTFVKSGRTLMHRVALAVTVATATLGTAAPATAVKTIPMTADRWDIDGEVRFVEQDGRATIRLGSGPGLPLKSGGALLRGVDFSTGTVEFDMLASGIREFASLVFRAGGEGNSELFYVRPHQNGNPDSTQYTPVVNGNLAWQIFTGEGFTSTAHFNYGHWMHVRADIYPDSALITIDGVPALTITHLKSSRHSGSLGFNATAGTYFANLNVVPIPGYRDPHPAAPLPPLPEGSVTSWKVAAAMPEDEAMGRAARRDWSGLEWHRIPTESNGIGNLSLAGPDSEGRHSFIARFTLRSGAAQTATMHFGFSDKVHVLLNGRLLYAGEDLQGSRDYRFLGIVGFWDTLFLPLERGANDVAFVVTDETNGGTAAAARLEPSSTLTID